MLFRIVKTKILIGMVAALALIGCTEKSGVRNDAKSDFNKKLEQAKGYTYPNDTIDLDTARQMGLALLEHDSVKTNEVNQMHVLRLLTDVARMNLDYEEQAKWAQQLVTLCRKNHQETEALRTESEIGIVFTHLGQRKEGLALLDNVINQLEGQRRFCALDACIIAMKRKLTALSLMPPITMPDDTVTMEQRQYEIIALADRFMTKLDDYEQHPSDYLDGSDNTPTADEVTGYCDFYRSQAYVFLAQAYATLSYESKAREYLALFEQTPFGQTLNGRSAISETQRILGDYDKMLATYDEIDNQKTDDHLNSNDVRQLRGRAMAAEASGDHAASQQYWMQYSVLSQAINDELQASQAHNYAARYHAQEQQRIIEMQREGRKTAMAVNLAITIALIAVVAIALILYHRNNLIRQKNLSLARQISEGMDYKEKYQTLRQAGQKSDDSTTSDPNAMDAQQLFHYLSQIIIDQQLFLDPDFDRQSSIDRFHLSKERIGAAFSQGSDYHSMSAFVTACRLEYATRILLSQPTLPIAQVASASGFSSSNHFGRAFKNAYGLSATEYRNANKGED